MNNAPTLNQFFAIKDLSKEKLSEMAKSKQFGPIKEKMSKELKGIPVPEKFFEEIFKQLSDLLNIDIRAILLSVWSKSGEFQKYLDAKNYPPDEVLLVPLAEHTITSEHNPSLESFMNKIPLGKMTFHINIELALKGAIIKIQNGKLWGGSIGSCAGKGSITFGDAHVLEKKSQPISLPSTIDLNDGIPIHNTAEDLHTILSKIAGLTDGN